MSTYYVETIKYSVFEKLISNTYHITYFISKINNKTVERILHNLLKEYNQFY